MDGVNRKSTGAKNGVGVRRRVLATYLERVGRLGPDGIGSEPFPVRDPGLGLELWERNGLQLALNGGSGPPEVPPTLLIEGIALRSKMRDELLRFERDELGDGETREHLTGELIIDAAIGLTLIQDAQRVINESILNGDMRRAKRLTAFRAKIRNGVNRVAEHLGADAFRLAREQAESLASADTAPVES